MNAVREGICFVSIVAAGFAQQHRFAFSGKSSGVYLVQVNRNNELGPRSKALLYRFRIKRVRSRFNVGQDRDGIQFQCTLKNFPAYILL